MYHVSSNHFSELAQCSLNQGRVLMNLEDLEQPSLIHWTPCTSWASRSNMKKRESNELSHCWHFLTGVTCQHVVGASSKSYYSGLCLWFSNLSICYCWCGFHTLTEDFVIWALCCLSRGVCSFFLWPAAESNAIFMVYIWTITRPYRF